MPRFCSLPVCPFRFSTPYFSYTPQLNNIEHLKLKNDNCKE